MSNRKPLQPVASVRLSHRPDQISYAAGRFAVKSQYGKITTFDGNYTPVTVRGGWGKVHSISLDRTGKLLAVSHDNQLTILDDERVRLFSCSAPAVREPALGSISSHFDHCFFDSDNDWLWCVAPISTRLIEIQLRRPHDWCIEERIVIDDPYGNSSCSFHAVPHEQTVALWLAAGQDGQQVYWLTEGNGLRCTIEPALADSTPPDFSSNGREFLVFKDEGTVSRFQYPKVREIGWCSWWEDDENDGLGYYQCYLDDRYALVNSWEGRLFAINLDRMELHCEISISGHLSRPMKERYPNLNEDKTLCTDMSYFIRRDDQVVTVHQQRDEGDPEKWAHSLLMFPVDRFRELIET